MGAAMKTHEPAHFPFWIGPDENLTVGRKGFLLKMTQPGRAERYVFRGLPAIASGTFEPRLDGFCGTANDVSTFAMGVWMVQRKALNGNGRALITQLTGFDLEDALEDLGYPELAPA